MIKKAGTLCCILFAAALSTAGQRKPLSFHIGEKFQLDNIVDSTGKTAVMDFTRSDFTIIDLWFNTCAPCIKEMTQFATLLSGKEKKITVVSISINNFPLWKKTFLEHSGRFSFLAAGLSNWQHYNLLSALEVDQQVPADRLEELRKKYAVEFFPAYFVLDRNGIIQSRPSSAVKFIKVQQ